MSSAENPHQSLSQDLANVLAKTEGNIPVGTLLEEMGNKGFGILLAIFSLPSALPVPAPGYSIPFGILLWILGMQMILGATAPVLPEKAKKRTLSRGLTQKMIDALNWFLKKTERFIRPRMEWIGSRGGRVFMGLLVLFMATLMMIPIPLTNTAPAMVVFIIGIGLSERDGIFSILACIAGVFAVGLYVGVIVLLFRFVDEYGWHAMDQFKDWLLAFFS